MNDQTNPVISLEDQSGIDLRGTATIDASAASAEVLREKLTDALIPGYQAEFDPEEAVQVGAFIEDALSEQDAAESDLDLVEAAIPSSDDRRKQ